MKDLPEKKRRQESCSQFYHHRHGTVKEKNTHAEREGEIAHKGEEAKKKKNSTLKERERYGETIIFEI